MIARSIHRSPLKKVGSFHAPLESVEYAEAVILMKTAWRDNRLFANDALALHLFDAAAGVVDNPVAAQELDGLGAVVLNVDEIGEDELSLDGI
jgi:hypothetical protein